jgi:hypothetical protein
MYAAVKSDRNRMRLDTRGRAAACVSYTRAAVTPQCPLPFHRNMGDVQSAWITSAVSTLFLVLGRVTITVIQQPQRKARANRTVGSVQEIGGRSGNVCSRHTGGWRLREKLVEDRCCRQGHRRKQQLADMRPDARCRNPLQQQRWQRSCQSH